MMEWPIKYSHQKIRFYHSLFIGKSIKKKENITAEIIDEKTP
jgi:hypothetical protein